MKVQEFIFNPFTEQNFIEVVRNLHFEKVRLERALIEIREQLLSYDWLEEGGRGSYEWDDDRYYQEIENCFTLIRGTIDQTLKRTDHQLCCEKFGSVNPDVINPVQLTFKFYEDFLAFTEDVLKASSVEGDI